MDVKEASKLKKYGRVMWDSNNLDAGTVCFHNDFKTGIWIKWDDEKVNGGWIDYEDMQRVSRIK